MSKLEQKENNVRCVGAGDEGMEWSNAPFIGAQWGSRASIMDGGISRFN